MSQIFFNELESHPDVFLGVGSGSRAQQTARIMVACERVLLQEQPDVLVLVGDVNSTVACALTAAKLCVPIAHCGGGAAQLRPHHAGGGQLGGNGRALGTLIHHVIPRERFCFVGNVMIDTLPRYVSR